MRNYMLLLDDGDLIPLDCMTIDELDAVSTVVNGVRRTCFRAWEEGVSSGQMFVPDSTHAANAAILDVR